MDGKNKTNNFPPLANLDYVSEAEAGTNQKKRRKNDFFFWEFSDGKNAGRGMNVIQKERGGDGDEGGQSMYRKRRGEGRNEGRGERKKKEVRHSE